MQIEGKEFSLFIDYDRGKYRSLSFAGKVKYLKERVSRILVDPCKASTRTILINELGLVVATAVCAMISAASTFLKGERPPKFQDGKYFGNFVKQYMDPVLQTDYRPGQKWADWLYSEVRCGLAHSFAIERGGVEYELLTYVQLKPYGPEINPIMLLDDFENGWSKYLGDVLRDGHGNGLGLLFEKRFDEIFRDVE